MPRTFLRANIAFSILAALSGCSSAPMLPPESASALIYRLDSGDKLRLTVFNAPSLSGEFAVTTEGDLLLPLIGKIPVRGKSLDEASALIQSRFESGYLVDPKTTLDVIAYRPYYIFGEVARSGSYPFTAGMTIEQAVAAAGGFSYRANNEYVFIKRPPDTSERRINIKSSTVHVMPGDTIRVGERYL